MLVKFFLWLWRIKNYDKIPKLPRGMLASEYEHISRDEARVLAKLGARDPAGIKRAMKRYKVSTIEELVALLEIELPRRNMLHKIRMGLGRLVGGYDYQPHAREIMQELSPRNTQRRRATKAAEQRLKQVKEALRNGTD